MSFALLFSGQGMQHPAMLPWLAEDDSVRAVERLLGRDWRSRLSDVAWAGRNAHAQPLLTGLGLAAWAQLAPALPDPAAVAGYSVGELAAFAAAGVYDGVTAVALAQQRAALMDQTAGDTATGLLGVNGLSGQPLERLCADFGLAVAIRNGIDSVVLGGPRAALAAAADAARLQGAHGSALNVGLASHTPWMAAAARAFAACIEPLPFRPPRILLFGNAEGCAIKAAQLKPALARQIDHTVRWDACMENIAARRVRCVLEIGPGQALARMWNQRHAQIPARSVDEFRSLEAVRDWVERHVS
jgi:[acyl-carrier-protein] S-malonyltransferase